MCILLYCFSLAIATPVYKNDVINVFADEKFSEFALSVAKPLTERIYSFHKEIGIYPKATADFHIISGKTAYQQVTKDKSIIVEHSDAFYSSNEQRIYIRSPEQISENYLKILLHEYIHWYLDYIFATAPLWFHEGMAVQYSHQVGYDRYYLFVRERFWGNKLKLNDMYYRYPKQKSEWNLFYLTSAFVIKYMRDEHPNEWKTFWDLTASAVNQSELDASQSRPTFSYVFYSAYQRSAKSFEYGFDRYTRRLALQYLLLGINGIVFGMLPFVIIWIYVIRRKRHLQMPDYPDLPIDEGSDPEAIYSEEDDFEDTEK